MTFTELLAQLVLLGITKEEMFNHIYSKGGSWYLVTKESDTRVNLVCEVTRIDIHLGYDEVIPKLKELNYV